MKNITGNAGTWNKEEAVNDVAEEVIIDPEMELITSAGILTNLKTSHQELNYLYSSNPKKEVYDALMNIQLAINSIKNLN